MRFSLNFNSNGAMVDEYVCLEICRSHIRLAIISAGADRTVHLVEARWRDQANSLMTDAGLTELCAAIERLSDKYDLAGKLTLALLAGDLCVTRTAIGGEEAVEHELAGFESRAQRYLTLGHGRKTHAARMEAIGGGVYHGVLAVCNARVVTAIHAACRAGGLQLRAVEPSIVSLARLVQQQASDVDEPVLLGIVDGEGVEFGIAHQGRVISDFRPAKGYTPEELANATLVNYWRLQRESGRYQSALRSLGAKNAELQRMFVIGANDRVERALARMAGIDASMLRLAVDPIPISTITADSDSDVDGRFAAVLGGVHLAAQQVCGPNLIEELDGRQRNDWKRSFRKYLAAAAMLVAAAGFEWFSFAENQVIDEIMLHHHSAGVQARIKQSQAAIRGIRRRLGNFEALDRSRREQPMQGFAQDVAKCLPQDIWLLSVRVGGDGNVTLFGSSMNESSLYRAVDALRLSPSFEKLTLTSTSATDRTGAVDFELRGTRLLSEGEKSESK